MIWDVDLTKFIIKLKGSNPPNCIILDNWDFKNSVLADASFAKAMQILETCVLLIIVYVEH